MNIFYFNITYTCNSNCVFCYSHNTIHSGRIFNEISTENFIDYLRSNNIKRTDRVIINGGEPFLHSDIINLLKSLLCIECEVLVVLNLTLLQVVPYRSILGRSLEWSINNHVGGNLVAVRLTRAYL